MGFGLRYPTLREGREGWGTLAFRVSSRTFAAGSNALLSWSTDDGHPLGTLQGKIGSTPEIVHMSVYEGTLYFFGDLPADSGTPGKYSLHAMDIASRKILWTHRSNRPIKYFEDWPSDYALPASSGV